MKSTLMCCAALVVIMAGATLTLGDLALPKESPAPVQPSKTIKTTLVVVPEANAWTARLQIPRSSLRQLRAATDNGPADDALGQTSARTATGTIMAGLCMFLAISFGGVWLVRSGHSRSQKAAAGILLAVALVGATAMITRGNAAPPPGWKWQKLSQNLNGGVATTGAVEVEIVPEGSSIKLIVPMYKTSAENQPGE